MSGQEQHGRIVVGVDGSEHSVDALRWALRQAVLTGATVDAVSCWARPVLPVMAAGYGPYMELDLADLTSQAAVAAVDAARSRTAGGSGVEVSVRVVEGYAATVLTEDAVGADVLVVGSTGHGALSRVLLGSVGLHCATHARCPVVIVHQLPEHPHAAQRDSTV